MSILTADALFNYGRALLENGVKNTDLLGNNQPIKEAEKLPEEDVSESEEEDEEEAPDMSRKFFSFEADIDQADKEVDSEGSPEPEAEASGEQGQTDKAAEEDDFDLAWQSFDSARVIYKHHLEQQCDVASSSSNPPPPSENLKKISHKLGEVLLALGDLSLESENFQQAILDYQEAVQVKQQCLESHDRRVAEAIYKLAVAYEYLPDRPQASYHLKMVIEVLEAHILSLDTNKDASEIKEIRDLLKEINNKLEDLTAPQADLVPGLAKELVNAPHDTGFQGPQENARDINTLIKRKQNNENSDCPAKRQCN